MQIGRRQNVKRSVSCVFQVAVQLPMFNERAVCQAIIDSACEMHWPSDRFCVQVSTAAGSVEEPAPL
jgi:hypothetical protein